MPARYSILFGADRPDCVDDTPRPAYFGDLRLDQVVTYLTGPDDELDLAPLYHSLVTDTEMLRLRQGVFDDLASPAVRRMLDAFTAAMTAVTDGLRVASTARMAAHRNRWQLDAAVVYCEAVRALGQGLQSATVSEGLRTIGRLVSDLAATPDFLTLEKEAAALERRLQSLTYAVFVDGGRLTVGAYDGEADYGAQVRDLFARFRQQQHAEPLPGETDPPRVRRARRAAADPVRDRIVTLVEQQFPELFTELDDYCREHAELVDENVGLFSRELQFYLRYDDLCARLHAAGLPTTRATLRAEPGLDADETYDVALALRAPDGATVVRNAVALPADRRRLVVTGPNQGGKTTFSRTIGQLHHLAGTGCPVAGTRVESGVADRIFTHFEREERGHETGKLEDDLLRIRSILDQATPRSLVVLNEIFASTTTADAAELGTRVLDALERIGALCVCVTFLDELARLPGTVTYVAQVDADDPAVRTFRVVRGRADGRAYARALAVSYGLTYDNVRERVR